jgi:hypothetical protein
MEIARISVKLIGLCILLFFSTTLYAQRAVIDKGFLNGIIDTDLDIYHFDPDSDYICIIVHDKRCSKCGIDVCELIDKKAFWGKGRVLVIDYLQHNISNVLPHRAIFARELPCADEVLFKFYSPGEENLTINDQPTPQVLLVRKGRITYIDYATVMNLVRSSR